MADSGHGQEQRTIVPLMALLAADAISMSGNAMAAVAIPWFVLETTGSVTDTALSGVAGAVPIIIAAVAGGVWVDRLGHKRASVYSDIASGVTIALIPLLYGTGWLSFPALLALIFLGALLDAPGAAARGALVPDVAKAAGLRLEAVNTFHEVIESGSGFAGPLFAGVLISLLTAGNVLFVDAMSFGLSALLVALLIPRFHRSGTAHTAEAPPLSVPQTEGAFPGHPHLEEEDDPNANEGLSVWAAFRVGLSFVWSDGPMRAIYGSAVIMNFLLAPLFGLLLPVYVRDIATSATALGAVIAAFSGGAVAGAIVYGARGHRWPRRPTFLVGGVAFAAGILAMSLLLPVPALIGVMFLMGLIVGPNGPLISTITHERTPVAMRGRVLSIVNAMCMAGGPAGFLIMGWLVASTGWQFTVFAAGVLFAMTVLVLAFDRGLRELDAEAVVPALR